MTLSQLQIFGNSQWETTQKQPHVEERKIQSNIGVAAVVSITYR